jgi:hypothetical protein
MLGRMHGKVNRNGYCSLMYSALDRFRMGMSGGVIGSGRQEAAGTLATGSMSASAILHQQCEPLVSELPKFKPLLQAFIQPACGSISTVACLRIMAV